MSNLFFNHFSELALYFFLKNMLPSSSFLFFPSSNSFTFHLFSSFLICLFFLSLFFSFFFFSQFASFPQFGLPFPESAAPVLPHFLLPCTLPWGRGSEAVKVRGRGGGCHFPIFVFAPIPKIPVLCT